MEKLNNIKRIAILSLIANINLGASIILAGDKMTLNALQKGYHQKILPLKIIKKSV